jgi:hypothetical protein
LIHFAKLSPHNPSLNSSREYPIFLLPSSKNHLSFHPQGSNSFNSCVLSSFLLMPWPFLETSCHPSIEWHFSKFSIYFLNIKTHQTIILELIIFWNIFDYISYAFQRHYTFP